MLGLFLVFSMSQTPATSPSPTPQTSPAAQQSPAAQRSPAVKSNGRDTNDAQPPTKGQRQSINATLQAIDGDSKTVSFIDPEGRTKVWPIDVKLAAAVPGRAAQLSAAFKLGQTVIIEYVEDTPGSPVVVGLLRGHKRRGRDVPNPPR